MTEAKGVSVGTVAVKYETDKALLVQWEDGSKEWVPKSVIHDDSEVYHANQIGDLILLETFAERKGWV